MTEHKVQDHNSVATASSPESPAAPRLDNLSGALSTIFPAKRAYHTEFLSPTLATAFVGGTYGAVSATLQHTRHPLGAFASTAITWGAYGFLFFGFRDFNRRVLRERASWLEGRWLSKRDVVDLKATVMSSVFTGGYVCHMATGSLAKTVPPTLLFLALASTVQLAVIQGRHYRQSYHLHQVDSEEEPRPVRQESPKSDPTGGPREKSLSTKITEFLLPVSEVSDQDYLGHVLKQLELTDAKISKCNRALRKLEDISQDKT